MLDGKNIPDPKSQPTPEGIHDFRDPYERTLTTLGWVVAAILMPIPSVVLWFLHRVGYWPHPCSYFVAWTVIGFVVLFLAGFLA